MAGPGARKLTVFEENARLRLSRDALVLVPEYTEGLWWFVTDVNYPDRTITAATLMFGQLREVTFPFGAVELHTLWTIAEQNEAGVAWRQVSAELSPRTRRLRSAA